MGRDITERDIEEYLSYHLEFIEPRLKLIGRQYTTKYGVIDLFCINGDKEYVVIEVKKVANTDSPGQVAKYIFATKQKFPNSNIKGILISEGINKKIKDLCDFFGISFMKLAGNISYKKINIIKKPENFYGLTVREQKFLEGLIKLHLKTGKSWISLPELAKYIYPIKDYQNIGSTMSENAVVLEELCLICKGRHSKNVYVKATERNLKSLDTEEESNFLEIINRYQGIDDMKFEEFKQMLNNK